MTTIVVVVTFLSCNDDFDSVGSEIIGDVNFEDNQYSTMPIAYSKKLERVQTSNLIGGTQNNQVNSHANVLGVYNDPVYGQSVYSILSQVQMTAFNPSFGENAVLDKVILNLPYFSEEISSVTNEDNVTTKTYELDSVYGNKPFRLSIYKSDYFLRDFDPVSSDRQIYYSNDVVDNFGSEVEKPENLLHTEDDFEPSALELVVEEPDGNDEDTDPDITRIPPALRIEFSDVVTDKFKALFLDKEGSAELSNANNFFNYFRGIYFKAEPLNPNDGNLVLFNMRGGTITLYYTSDTGNTVDDGNGGTTAERTQKTLVLSFANNIVNSIQTDLEPSIADELKVEEQDMVNGEETLYIKGGNGAYSVIELFNRYVDTDANGDFIEDAEGNPIFIDTPVTPTDADKTELDFLRSRDWLINDADLTFYIDQSKVITGGDTEPERIYIFNMSTGSILADYSLDRSLQLFNESDPVNSVLSHLGRINRGSDDRGEFYKIRLTQHIINLLKDDQDENVKLGLSVSQNINIVSSATGVVKNIINNTLIDVDEIIPASSIISHEGTVLYGNRETVPESKRLKLNIFYTASKKD